MKRSTAKEIWPWWCCNGDNAVIKKCRRITRRREKAAWKRDLHRSRL